MMLSNILLLLLVGFATTETSPKIRNYKISMVSSDTDPELPARFTHGESPVWDPDRSCLFFVDVLNQNVHQLDYDTGNIYTKHVGYGQVNVVSLVESSRRLLVAVRAALYLLDWETAGDAALRLLAGVDFGQPDNVINEGKSDAAGRFWAGTKGPQTGDDVVPDRSTFYRITQETLAQPHAVLRPVSISNGLVWSLNNTVLYYIDSPTQKIEAFDFDVTSGDISGRRTIVDITQYGYDEGIPDGMTIDSRGYLWVAVMFGGAVLHIDPDSRLVLHEFKLPTPRVTSLAWGGPALDELFVTTAQDAGAAPDARADPLAGAVFTLRDTGYHGVPHNRFRFDNADSY